MSRVDEAMRRAAAEATQQPLERVEGAAAGVLAEIESIEPAFPHESVEHRSRTAVVAPPVASAAVVPSVAPSVAVVTPVAPPAMISSSVQTNAAHAQALDLQLRERLDGRFSGKAVVDADVLPGSREQYRRLAAGLHHAQLEAGLKVVMVTSAAVGEGKTLTAANLALTFSESYDKKVLLIDADLRRPTVHTLFRVDNEVGLSIGLTSREPMTLPVHRVSRRLSILSAGRPTSDPIAGLTSKRMRMVIDEAREAFDWIVVDTPPVALLPDANLLGSMTDGALLVVRAGTTSYRLVERAVEAIGRERVLGVVLNDAQSSGGEDYYYYYYSPRDEGKPSGSS